MRHFSTTKEEEIVKSAISGKPIHFGYISNSDATAFVIKMCQMNVITWHEECSLFTTNIPFSFNKLTESGVSTVFAYVGDELEPNLYVNIELLNNALRSKK